MDYIKPAFDTLGIKLTSDLCRKFHHLVVQWETRGVQPLCLNSQLIGIHTIVFTDADRAALFHIVGLTEPQVKAVVAKIPTIDKTRRVSSDSFNLLSVWLLHLGLSIKDPREQNQFRLDVAKYLHYKFFTSLVNHYLPHGADESVMLAAITSMNRRFDLIVHGSWRATIEARCEDLISLDPDKNIHETTMEKMAPDQMVLYVVTDTQTRIRDKVGNICEIYYNFHKDGVKIKSVSATGIDSEGEKFLIQRVSTLDTAVTAVTTDLMSVNNFLETKLIDGLSKQFNDVSPALLRAALEVMVQIAVSQARERTLDDVKTKPGGMFEYVGMRVLVREIIQTSIEYCAKNGIDLSSRASVFHAIRNRYASSQIKDARILSVKESVESFVDALGKTSRPATKASLRLAIIMYVITKCLLYI